MAVIQRHCLIGKIHSPFSVSN